MASRSITGSGIPGIPSIPGIPGTGSNHIQGTSPVGGSGTGTGVIQGQGQGVQGPSPGGTSSSSLAGTSGISGDWLCPDPSCGNVNFNRRMLCNRCGKDRPVASRSSRRMGTEIGKSAAVKSRGLFSADDWQCSKCANVNWARRHTCNVCNAPKFGEVEARTGYGGGYNERGTVEYRNRRDSDDDEYDEFGRLKKRKTRDHPKVGGLRGRNVCSEDSPASREFYDFQRPLEDQYEGKTRKRSSTRSSDPVNDEHFGLDVHRSRYDSGSYPLPNKSTDHNPKNRECIMENRVTSTNDVKYRFSGKTVDENFEVIYTLEERIMGAVWAISYQNCKTSAEIFQYTFDKPAPDFKVMFGWRQRLLNTGCLVDSHVTDTKNKKINKIRKRKRYFKCSDSSTDEDSETDNGSRNRKRLLTEKEKRSDVVTVDDYDCGKKLRSAPFTKSKETEYSNSTARSSSRDDKNSDSFVSDGAISANRESCFTRSELGNSNTWKKSRSPETQSQNNSIISAKSTVDNDLFTVPDVPKSNSKIATQESSKSMLEDIVSESERYSSDEQLTNRSNKSLDRSEDRYSGNQYSHSLQVDRRHSGYFETDDDHLPKRKAALRKIENDISATPDNGGLEYIPTKIDPMKAKKNLEIFKSEALKRSDMSTQNTSANDESFSTYANYIPDNDSLYRNSLSDSESGLKTPPAPPNIGSIQTQTETKQSNTTNISDIMNIDLSNINTDNLASVLKNIQQKSNSDKDVEITEPQTIAGIPFLEDMFHPGTPPYESEKTAEKPDITLNIPETNLDDILSLKPMCLPGSFKSFAIPKPILLNRLKNSNKNKMPPTTNSSFTAKKSDEISSSHRKHVNNDEEEEESGDEGDLSKYDLWGSDTETNKPDDKNIREKEEKVMSSNNENNTSNSKIVENVNKSTSRKKRSSSESSKRSSSSSSSSSSSTPRAPRNKYDDFNLNSEACSRSSSSRSRSPHYPDKKKSHQRSHNKDREAKHRDRGKDYRHKERGREKDRSSHRNKSHNIYSKGRAR